MRVSPQPGIALTFSFALRVFQGKYPIAIAHLVSQDEGMNDHDSETPELPESSSDGADAVAENSNIESEVANGEGAPFEADGEEAPFEANAPAEVESNETETPLDETRGEPIEVEAQHEVQGEEPHTEAISEPSAESPSVEADDIPITIEDELPPPPPPVDDTTEEELLGFDTIEDELPPPPPPPTSIDPGLTPPTASSPLERRLDRRILGGVSAGLAEYWGVSVTWIRLGFAVLSAFAFLGVFVYAAAWVLIPPNDGTEAVADSLVHRLRHGESWMGAALIALAALIIIGSLDFVSGELAFAVALFVLGFMLYRGVPDRAPPPPGGDKRTSHSAHRLSAETHIPEVGSPTPPPSASPPRAAGTPPPPRLPRPRKPPSILNRLAVAVLFISIGVLAIVDFNGVRVEARHYFATGLAVVATALMVGAWRGRARLMIIPGVILLLPAFFLSFTNLSFDDTQLVDLNLRPQTAADIETLYRFDAGNVTLDLTSVDQLPNRLVRVDLDAGRIAVILPNDASARVVSRVGAGSITDVGYGDGLNVERRVVYRGEGEQIQLELSLDFGEINVIRSEQN